MRWASLLLSVILSGLVLGCSRPPAAPPVRVHVQGEITYDGQKVENGIISFLPLEGTRVSGGGPIKNGSYYIDPDVRLMPGTYRVEIRWAKPTGELKSEVGYGQSPIIYAEAIPEKYNKASTLKAEVQAGDNTIDFHLEK